MKNTHKNIVIIALILIIIVLTIQLNSTKNEIINNKKIIKAMSSSIQETELNEQINALNIEHTDYMNYIQECKTKIATALTNQGIETSNQETLEIMAENIGKIETKNDSNIFPTSTFKTWQNYYSVGITSATLEFDGKINVVATRNSGKGGATYFVIFNADKPINLKEYNTITLNVQSALNTSWVGWFLVDKDTDLDIFQNTTQNLGQANVIDDKVLYRKDFSPAGNNTIDVFQDDISNYDDEYYIGAYFGGYAGNGFTQNHNLTLYNINLN